ncbi:hypothetical protein [Turicibacter sp. T129]|uniref:hypothetical protein n=1 Tax=Turicibacter sp. T129 TaxID=2951141 RepID=UPI0021D4A71E|nr:hypothetical protein [Turicibacter sp. T129]MCU7193187.1 hypothetical protein [Turicibacter sp. T129]
MMTINEYKSKNELTNGQLADLLDVSESSIEKYLMGDATSAAVAKRMSKLGIEHPYRRGHVKGGDDVPVEEHKRKKVKSEFDSKFLKEYQVVIVREFGNTIVSKKHKPEEIVSEFAKFGLNVKVRDFENKTYEGWNTHYVVELVGGEL